MAVIFIVVNIITMKNSIINKIAVSISILAASFNTTGATEPVKCDSVRLFCYSKADGRSGLRLAWSEEGIIWNSICLPSSSSKSGFNFVSSDFGPWGSHKTMFSPRIFKTSDGWMAVWYVSDRYETLASAKTPNFIKWEPQRYVVKKDSCSLGYCGLPEGREIMADVAGRQFKGEEILVSRKELNDLIEYMKSRDIKEAAEKESMKDDNLRFKGLKPLTGNITISSPGSGKKISDKLIGIFFEDINYSADGGLYGELVQNRDFEYKYEENHREGWGPSYAWKLIDSYGYKKGMNFNTENPIHTNNSTYLTIKSEPVTQTLINKGFDGITLKKGDKYRFSMFVNNNCKNCKSKFGVRIISDKGELIAKTIVTVKGKGWQKVEKVITANDDVSNAKLAIDIPSGTSCDLDMISLFPVNTYNNRENGLRKDLAEVLADLKPRFIRFPGGCVAHGDGIDNIYDWKGSIGPLEARKPLRNIWNYHQSRGLGYHEYFLMCEDFGAEPLPVLAAGVPCQNSGRKHSHSHNEITSLGQQCGIPMDDMDDYVQDILDLIEYANDPVDSEWGAKRAAAGHPEPFNMKYIGIGNEDMITDVFEERFKYIHDILQKEHPEITVVGTVGPFYEGSDYDEGWEFAKKENVAMVDEHYYVAPGWYLNNRDFYDNYDRKGPHVYLGEYASHIPSRDNTLETALTIGLYLTDVERNGDVVEMTSYAPLLAKEGHYNWRPDLIFFNNDSISFTPDYYVQHMYGNNSGTLYIPTSLKLSDSSDDVVKRVGVSMVKDEESNDFIIKIANLLPVEISFEESLSALGILDSDAQITVLSGSPDDKCTKPYSEYVKIIDGILKFTSKPYSLSVIRIPN